MDDGRFLTDYRSANTREQYIKSINGFVNTDQYRTFLQTSADKIMDNEWDQLTLRNNCQSDSCVHMLPSRVPLGATEKELELYNLVQSGKIKKGDQNFPTCPKYNDYRMSDTPKTKY